MCSLLLLIAQETEQKMAPKPDGEGDAQADEEKPNACVAGSSSSSGGGDKPHSSYSGIAYLPHLDGSMV